MAKFRSNKQISETSGGPEPKVSRTNVSTIEDEWLMSRVKGDMEFSDRLIDEAYRGTTSDGVSQSKSDFMQAIARSVPSHSGAQHRESDIQIYGELAISTGLATIQSGESAHSFRYLRVFRNVAGTWRLIASQSTRIARRG